MTTAHPRSDVPAIRIRPASPHSVRAEGEFVLYWMTTARRLSSNFSLQRALDWCEHLGKPLVIFEPIGCRARWSCDRFHQFVLQGMRDQHAACEKKQIAYLPYVEPKPKAAASVMRGLADRAAVIVTDDFPCYIVPSMIAAMAKQSRVLLEAVDGNGLLPMRAADKVFPSAYAFRRYLQKGLLPHLSEQPQDDPFRKRKLVPLPNAMWQEIIKFATPADEELLSGTAAALAKLPIDHRVSAASSDGGETAAKRVLKQFLSARLSRYADERNQPEADAASGLSPYLHFGHIGVYQIFQTVTKAEDWTPETVSKTSNGSKEGWWNLSLNAESFLDELITWRELGYNFCSHRDDYDRYESLPEWAQATLQKHAEDVRPVVYTPEQLESAETGDELWNAAQRQLMREGRMHNYLRMLWGKKVLEWSPTPQEALATLIDLNNKYAVDGRNPNSYSGIFWIFGRYDRPWGPERKIFGTIRYMSSANTTRKLDVKGYLARYGRQSSRSIFDQQ